MKTLILFIMLQFTLPPLPYEYEALKPTISEETLRYHHDKHHLAYVNSIFNNAAQVWNHTFYFEQFGTWTPIEGQLAQQIVRQWGTIEKFQEEFVAAGISQFGSGWVWLVCDKDGELSILTEPNAGNPLTKGYIPLMTFDVWEHAYYIDYRNLRGDYLNALWQILDWRIIEDRYMFFLDY